MKKFLLISIIFVSFVFAMIDERKSHVYFANGIDLSKKVTKKIKKMPSIFKMKGLTQTFV